MSNSLQPHGLCSPWHSPGQNTGVVSLSLLQGVFPTQGYNPSLPHNRQILFQLSHKWSPRILEWVDYPFSRGIFLTQESNWGLLLCRRIVCQLSYQGVPNFGKIWVKQNETVFFPKGLLGNFNILICTMGFQNGNMENNIFQIYENTHLYFKMSVLSIIV